MLTNFRANYHSAEQSLPDCSSWQYDYMHPDNSINLHTFPTSDSDTLSYSELCLLPRFSGIHFTAHSICHWDTKQRPDFDVQQHIPLPTFSMLVLSNCSLRSAMTALWDWRVWSDATCLLSRSRLTSSRDVTSFSSRHTSSSRCCCCDCHCKQTSNFCIQVRKEENFPMLSDP